MILTDPIVLFHDTVLCDGFGHEVTLTTDGITAYAESSVLVDTTTIERDNETVRAFCPWQSENGCHGVAEWDLSEPMWIAADADLIRTLGYGARMDLS